MLLTGMGGGVCGPRKCSWMSLTALSNELEIAPGSFPNTHWAPAEWCSKGLPTSSFFGRPSLAWK
jgi:hypothetical protein